MRLGGGREGVRWGEGREAETECKARELKYLLVKKKKNNSYLLVIIMVPMYKL